MSINFAGYNRRTIYCDTPRCEESDDIEGEWSGFLAEVKRRRWRIVKDGADWLHYCEKCAGKQGGSHDV